MKKEATNKQAKTLRSAPHYCTQLLATTWYTMNLHVSVEH